MQGGYDLIQPILLKLEVNIHDPPILRHRTSHILETLCKMYFHYFFNLDVEEADCFLGKNGVYEELFTMVRSNYAEGNKIVCLHHYSSGPTIDITCCKFLPTEPFQTRVLRKDASGWHWVGTTAYCLAENKLDLTPYIRECVPDALEDACNRSGPPAFFFRLARGFRHACSPPPLQS